MSGPTAELQLGIERFYYEEANLLDRHEYRAWLQLFTREISYSMPVRTNFFNSAVGEEPLESEPATFFDEDWITLEQRIKRLETGKAWAEMPPSRTRRMISNVYLTPAEGAPDSWEVSSNFIVYRSRLERQVDIFCGQRRDTLQPGGKDTARWQINRRLILIDQATLLANNLSIFF